MSPRPVICAAALLLLAACQSTPPLQQYTLLPPTTAVTAPARDPAFRVIVEPVTIPVQVDVPYFVVREGRNRLTSVETQRWAAPLADEVRAALIDGLHRGAGIAVGTDSTRAVGLPVYRLRVGLRRFDSVLGQQALIDAAWSVESLTDPDTGASCDSTVAVSIGDGYPALADGHQRAMKELAGRIAAGIDSVHAGRAAEACAAASGG